MVAQFKVISLSHHFYGLSFIRARQVPRSVHGKDEEPEKGENSGTKNGPLDSEDHFEEVAGVDVIFVLVLFEGVFSGLHVLCEGEVSGAYLTVVIEAPNRSEDEQHHRKNTKRQIRHSTRNHYSEINKYQAKEATIQQVDEIGDELPEEICLPTVVYPRAHLRQHVLVLV